MEAGILVDLLKAGGISALSVGVLYLLYREMLKLGVIPKLKQWQGFTLLCLLAVLVFVVVVLAITWNLGGPAKVENELPPDQHFQADSTLGLFCEKNNVRDQFITFFDYADINLGQCPSHPGAASRAYRLDYSPGQPRSVLPESRRNYIQCFISDFAEKAPSVVDAVNGFFSARKAQIPCEHSVSVFRIISVSYNNIRDEAKRNAFVQSFNVAANRKFEIHPEAATRLAQSDQMEAVPVKADRTIDPADLVKVVKDFHYPNVPAE